MSWQRIRGHESQVEGFARAAKAGRLAHAYVFVGPPGVGKRLFAFELAKTLLCERRQPADFVACDLCASCRLVDANTHPDVIAAAMPEDKQEFPINVMLELCRQLVFKPARGSWRVAIVDDADDFNLESGNAFLKSLEEPGPGSLIVLLANNPNRLPSTIRSRCQQVTFSPLPDAVVAELVASETHNVTNTAEIVRLANGSPSLARQLIEPGFWEFRRALGDELQKPKPNGFDLAKQWMKIAEDKDEGAAAARARSQVLVIVTLDVLRQALAVALGATPSDPVEAKRMSGIATRWGVDGLIDRIERAVDAETHIGRRAQLVLAVEGLLDALTLDSASRLRSVFI